MNGWCMSDAVAGSAAGLYFSGKGNFSLLPSQVAHVALRILHSHLWYWNTWSKIPFERFGELSTLSLSLSLNLHIVSCSGRRSVWTPLKAVPWSPDYFPLVSTS